MSLNPIQFNARRDEIAAELMAFGAPEAAARIGAASYLQFPSDHDFGLGGVADTWNAAKARVALAKWLAAAGRRVAA